MRTDDLTAFRAVVAAGSISGAARALGRSQPGLSRQVERLERLFGAPLLERAPSGIRLTAAGERVLAFATGVLDDLDAAREDVRRAAEGGHGLLRLIASTVPGEFLVAGLVARFSAERPDVQVRLSIRDSADVVAALVTRRADVGFTGIRSCDDRLTHLPFATDEVVLALPADHPLARRSTVPPSALGGVRLLSREQGSGTQSTFREAVAAAGLALPVDESVSLGSTRAVLAAVEAGLGVGVVSLRAISDSVPDRVAAVRLEGVAALRTLWVVFEHARQRPASHAAFIAMAERWHQEG